ncbi:MAG: hypothetical protein RLZ44_1646 [Pseudomonadota bacterium]|jgi:hypothetical protein
MARVVSRRIVTPRIVQPGSGGRRWLVFVGVLVLLGWTYLTYDLGRQQAGYHSGRAAAQRAEARAEIQALKTERDELRLRAASHERASQIDRGAAQQVQDQIKTLQEERAALKREVAFLRELIAADDGPLRLRDFRLDPLEQDHHYRYRFTVAQAGEDAGTVRGEIGVTVTGQRDGKAQTLTLEDLTEGELAVHKMRFRNFQDVEGAIELPKGFTPEALEVEIRPEGDKLKPVKRLFEWQLAGA